VKLVELVAPLSVSGDGGRAKGVELVRMQLGEADEKGRRQPVPLQDSGFLFPCETVMLAVGQVPTVEALDGNHEMNPLGGVSIDVLTGATAIDGIFAGGDCVSAGATVIEAVAAGQKAAVAIDRMLGGAGLLPANVGPSVWRPSDEQLERMTARAREPEQDPRERISGFSEAIGGLSASQACGEAARCMRCDLERAAARALSGTRASGGSH
jgi:NADPH-dependent glutamate synthase beta subunit-like oxidoreductase